MKALIVANAPFRFWPAAVGWAREADLLLAADGGANHLARVGLKPHFLVGDLDSVTREVRAWVGEERVVYRLDQDHTDLEKTLFFALERGVDQAVIVAATGGRVDHSLENLGILGRFSSKLACEIREETTRIVPVVSRASFEVSPGATVSFIPIGRCEHVWLSGVAWPLEGEPLGLLSRTSLSNRAVAPFIEVRVEGGVLLAFIPW